ncbi:MAG: MFS transporter [Candidatus Marinimicrobia bacterium]|nr:MFS transporter [Candidatus Neomarinimicrobiota bacterium]
MNTEKISLKEKVGYSLGDTASNLFFQTFILFITIFYTDVFGISAKAVGTMFLITKIWDAVNDPMMGMIADRTETRWGKFRPYILLFAIPFGIIGILTFTTPNLSATGKLIYAYVTYTLLMMLYTIINVPYSALMGVITSNARVRTVVSQFRFVAAFIGGLIVQYSVLRMVERFGRGNEPLGWQRAMIVLSSLAVVLLFITFASTKERVKPPKGQKTRLKDDLRDLFKNKPWLFIGGATVFQLTFILIRSGCIMYYFTYFVQDQQVMLLGKVYSFSYQSIVSTFFIAGSIVTILGSILASWFSKVLGKHNTYAGFLGASGIFAALFYFLGPNDVILMFVFQFLISFALGPVSVLQWAMYTDTVDYSEFKTGRRATGLVMSASLFALKFGVALGASILAWILAGYGYQPNVPQTAQSLLGIRLAMSIYAAIPALIGAGIMFFYPLTNEKMVEIEKELNARRKSEKSE